MKRTCLHTNTNTDEQNSCEFHLVEQLFEKRVLDPKDNQFVKSFVRMKIINLLLLLLISTAYLSAQNLEYGAKFEGIADNREFFGNYNTPQTIMGARGSFDVGFRSDSIHSFRAGLTYFYEFGGEFGELKPNFILYYKVEKAPYRFYMGAFPKKGLIDYPMAMIADTIEYYRPNVEGLYVDLHGKLGTQCLWIDWNSRQTATRRETFMAGSSGKFRFRNFLFEDYWMMYHFAGAEIDIPGDHLNDNTGISAMVGYDFSKLIPLDILTLKTGFISSFHKIRGVDENFRVGTTSYTDIQAEYKGYGIHSTINVGENLSFLLGDRFYNTTTSYIRNDLYFTPIRFKNIQGRFLWSIHIANGDLLNQQRFMLTYTFKDL